MIDHLQNIRTETHHILSFLLKIDDENAHKKLDEKGWSIMECMEHVFITEKGIYKLFEHGELFSNEPSNHFEKLEYYRSKKFVAPDITLPKGRFKTVSEISLAFKILRSQFETYIIHELPKTGEETYPHPILGPITKTQWIEFMIEHGHRHLLQMEQIWNKISTSH